MTTFDVADLIHTLNHAERASADENWAEAAELWERVTRDNPMSGAHWDALARARFGCGRYRGALQAHAEAEKLGVWAASDSIYPGEIAYRIAVCHARLGEHAESLTALARAKDLGLRDLSRIRDDEDLAALRGDPTFRRLFGIAEPTSRDDRWRADVKYLVQEAERHSPIWNECSERFLAASEELDRSISGLTDLQIVVNVQRLLRLLHDGHAGVDFRTGPPEWSRMLPVAFADFPEGIAVTATAPGHEHLLGVRVTAFDDRPVDAVYAAIEPLVCRDNDYVLKAAIPGWMRRVPLLHAIGLLHEPDAVTLTVERPDGTSADVEVNAVDGSGPGVHAFASRPEGWSWLPETIDSPLPLAFKDFDRAYWFEHLPDHATIYFQFNSIADQPEESIAEFSERLIAEIAAHDVQRLVVDLRWNGGGNTLLSERLVQRIVGCDRVNRPGHLFVITGRDTFSAAQNTATLLGRHADTVFVGEPSGSRPNFIGETIPFRLPHCGLRVNIADLSWQTSYPFDRRTWIPPLLFTPPTLEAFRANRDPALDAILAWTDELDGLVGRLR
jgi:tetratricopeptide (TPR) repeat protein